ncbi:MAG: helix-turn-helix transcriptional regulator, partial [Gammaproteobacteria bacterium]
GMADKFLRLLAMLEEIPRAPYKRSPAEIRARLREHGYRTDVRSVQRDLESLVGRLPIEADRRSKPYGWHWSKVARPLNLPRMTTAEAVTHRLVGMFLRDLLPGSVLQALNPQMQAAEKVLATLPHGGLRDWSRKVRLLPPGQPLIAPQVKPAVLAQLYEALLINRRVRARYRPVGEAGPRLYKELSPLGLVLRGQVLYMLCAVADYTDVLQFAAHRFYEVTLLDTPVNRPNGFDLDAYIQANSFDFPKGQSIPLDVLFRKNLAVHVQETPLSKDQAIEPFDDTRVRVRATVNDTGQLRWWLLSFGARVEVMGPPKLRAEMRETCRAMARRYA